MTRAGTLLVLLALATVPAAIGQTEMVYRDDFNSQALQSKVGGWDETSLNEQRTRRRAVSPPDAFDGYRIHADPTDDRNRVFGISSAVGIAGSEPGRTGLAATYSAIVGVRSTFTGRFYRASEQTAIGIFVLAALPESRRYYLLGTSAESGAMTLFAAGTTPGGTMRGTFRPAPGEWTRFRIETDEVAGATSIRARFWPDGTPEPAADAITAFDASPSRLLLGRIGVWSSGGGAALFDDFSFETMPVQQIAGPAVAVLSPGRGEVLAAARVDVTGRVDRAVAVVVNGRDAIVDTSMKTFVARGVELAEGPSLISVIATDADGLTAAETVAVVVDTRGPDLTIDAPAGESCTSLEQIVVRGRVFDRELASVRIDVGSEIVEAAVAGSAWTATIDAAGEGRKTVRVEAADTIGHVTGAAITLNVDRTPPILELLESGQPFTAETSNRALAFIATARDLSPHSITATLDGTSYESGTPVTAEGRHELRVVAADCAGNRTERAHSFTIDRTAPEIVSVAPESGSTSGIVPLVSGTASTDAVRIEVEPHRLAFPVSGGAFALDGLPLDEGRNELVFVTFDAAGNESRREYAITLKLAAPTVEILESGSPIAADHPYNRPITPEVRSSDPEATITAMLDGSPLAPGTSVATDGAHVVTAYATDALGHRSETASASFRIDRTPPSIAITAPSAGADISTDFVEVRGDVSTDAATVTVNGHPAALNGTTFSSNVPIEFGTNLIAATAADAAGNIASAHVEIDRESAPTLIITSPPDGLITNRRGVMVAGQVFASGVTSVSVNGEAVPVEITGLFRKLELPLTEGDNTITAAVSDTSGRSSSASLRVTADRTPPHVRLFESGQPLTNGARLPSAATITASVTGGEAQLFIDGSPSDHPVVVTDHGAHVAIAVARDAAGNEARVERSFFVGDAAGVCALSSFDPPHGSVVNSSSVVITGRSGGATGVSVNGVAATVSNGSFCATIELPAEGENAIQVRCTGAGGQPVGAAGVFTLRRVTGHPAIEITTPAEGIVVTTETLAVSGLVAGELSSVEVNGTAAAVAAGTFTATGVRLTKGWNVIVARARGAGGATAAASRRVLLLETAPALSITSPLPDTITGASSIDVSGVWQNLDPSTIAGASVTRWSDTTGTFVFSAAPLTPGNNNIVLHATDAAGRTTTTSVVVTREPTAPAVSITTPDNTFVAREAGEAIVIEGTFMATPGATIEVNGVPAVVNANTFTATIPLVEAQTLAVIARLTQPDGVVAIDTIRIHRTSGAPAVVEMFPAASEAGVDAGALPLVLFSTPMNHASIAGALRLESSSGAPVSGTLRVDREVVAFAPSTLLSAGERYTLRVSTAATDLAGRALPAEFSSSFTIAPGATGARPALEPLPPRICGETLTITGTAAPNARVRIDLGPLRFQTVASSAGTFSYPLPIAGQSGFIALRVRAIGADGSESEASQACVLVDCSGPRVVAASFDRSRNSLTVDFSKPLATSSVVNDAFALRLTDGRPVAAVAALQSNIVTLAPAEDLTQRSFILTIAAAIEDVEGRRLATPFVTTFDFESDETPQPRNGEGFISGEVFEASTGWPLAGATVTADGVSVITDALGRYAAQLPEGAHTLHIAAPGHIGVWRQVIVRAGAGVVPVDVRLTREHESGITPLDAQCLPGLLPLGWSPIAASHVADSSPASEFTFVVPVTAIVAAAQTLSAVRYEDDRDEWRVVAAVVNVASDGRVVVPIQSSGTYALVYGDRAPHLTRPPPAVTGATLQGVADPCASVACPELVATSFVLDPPLVLPAGRSTARLTIEGTAPHAFPSGSIVQAFVEEEIRLADGSRLSAPPFASDLVLHRALDGNTATAEFEITPSDNATAGVIETGFSNVRIQPYPGGVARGSLIGSEGGPVPGDGTASIDIPNGATADPIHATAAAIPVDGVGTVAGFETVSAFELTLQRAGGGNEAVELLVPSRVTLSASRSIPSAQHVIAEIVDGTSFGRVFRLVAVMEPRAGSRVATVAIERATLPIDGVVRAGRYVLLAAQSPIAFAYGLVRVQNGPLVRNARVRSTLGVTDVTGPAAVFALPVPASPSAPFTLIPRTVTSGDGVAYVHPSSPEPGSVIGIGELDLTIQPPQLASTFPTNGETAVSLSTFVKASFTPAIDPAALPAGAIVVSDSAMQPVAGTVVAEGNTAIVWTLPPGERLKPNTTYTVTLSPAIRGTNGAVFGRAAAFSFSTMGLVVNAEIRRDRIRITIPDANGRSRIIGAAGALPAGWKAVPVRRSTDFATRYQATAAADGGFTIAIDESVALTDRIDLQVVNGAGAIASVFPLTPFVTDDGRGFVAQRDEDARFVTPEGAAIIVAADSFDESIVISTAPSVAQDVTHVPHLASELKRLAGIKLSFEGKASKRIDLEIPIPPDLPHPDRQFVLGWLGESVRGPRIMIVDTLRVEDGKFTTAPAPEVLLRSAGESVLSPGGLKKHLPGIRDDGTFTIFSFEFPPDPGGPAWAVLSALSGNFDVFWDAYQSLYVSSEFIADNRRAVIPVPRGRQFEVVGVDASTGLEGFSKVYDPLPTDDPAAGYVLASPNPDAEGPYPVSGGPFRIEVAPVEVSGVELSTIRNFLVRHANGMITARDAPSDPLPAGTEVSMLNVTRGGYDASRAQGLSVPGEPGDRIVMLIEQKDVDPHSTISVVFSEPIWAGPLQTTAANISAYFHAVAKMERLDSAPGSMPHWKDITLDTFFRLDSGNRRLLVDLPALQRGARYRLSLLPQLVDASDADGGGDGLRIGQTFVDDVLTDGIREPLQLHFQVRAPGGKLGTFDLRSGSVRDFALNGNLLFVAALDGGLVAYDTSDPAGLHDGSTPVGIVSNESTQYWAVASDHHGRVFATAMTAITGALQTFALDQFLDRTRPAPRNVEAKSSMLVSWAPGAASSIGGGLSDTLGSGRPEAIPRKLQILLQDDDRVFESTAAFISSTGASAQEIDSGFSLIRASIPRRSEHPYLVQRITVENMTLDMRWSADATAVAPALFDEILARPTDRIRIIFNARTYAVIALFGFGIGVYDLNAVESNDYAPKASDYEHVREQIRLTRGALRAGGEPAENPCQQPSVQSYAIRDLSFVPEAAIMTRPGSSHLEVYALDPSRGVLDLVVVPPDETNFPHCERSPNGLVFRGAFQGESGETEMHDHPRLVGLRRDFERHAGRPPFGRFNSVAHYRWRLESADNAAVGKSSGNAPAQGQRGSAAGTIVERDYLLIAGNEYGLLVADAGGTPPLFYPSYRWLEDYHFVDLIWVPTGVVAVRTIPRTNLAVAIDGKGHALLIDLSRLDERWTATGELLPADRLFPSAERSVNAGTTWGGIGAPDPRVVWRSDTPVAHGTLAPVIDPDTGIVFAGNLGQKELSVLSAIDPRLQIKVDLGAPSGLSEVGGIVPLGIDPPKAIRDRIAAADPTRRANASLAAFRIEVTIPGGLPDQLTGANRRVHVAIESERVPNGVSEQLPAPYPRAHLRTKKRDGGGESRPVALTLDRVLPRSVPAARLRHQRGFNKYATPWIVAVADPRAAAAWEWPKETTAADKTAAGCASCDRPAHLRGKTEADGVYELYSTGRFITVRPDFCTNNCASNLFTGTPYAFLGARDRMVTRFPTVMADVVRPTSALVAAQNAPAAGGALQGTVYLHSGEFETRQVDLDAGGRAGWNVAFDRTYRSQSLGHSFLGAGWDSSIYRRVRPLPNGDVEYRDGAGETWRFQGRPDGNFEPTRGLFLSLRRTPQGWRIVDSKSRVTDFDAFGRIVAESDEFADDPARSSRGNIIRYLYGADGRLAQIIDPVGRASTLSYFGENESALRAGRLREIRDWRDRSVLLGYDEEGRLTNVSLPDVVNSSGARPVIRYAYDSSAADLVSRLELGANLLTITDPAQTAPRLTLNYGSGAPRDRIAAQRWTATGEAATFTYPTSETAVVVDALGQRRTYGLTAQPSDHFGDRAHIRSVEEHDVLTSTSPVGTVSAVRNPNTPPRAEASRKFSFVHDADGLVVMSRLEGVRKATYTYAPVPNAPGQMLTSIRTEPEGDTAGEVVERRVAYQPGNAFVQSVEAGGVKIDASEPHRANDDTTTRNDEVETRTVRDEAGRVESVVTTGGTDPLSPHGSDTRYHYFGDNGAPHLRGLLRSIARPGIAPVRHEYPAPDRIVMVDERNVSREVKLDAWRRPVHATTVGADLTFEESSEYDASGRLHKHQRRQGAITVTTQYEYDALGRPLSVTTDNVAIGGSPSQAVEKTAYDLASRKVTRTLATGAIVEEQLDTLGRVTTRTTTTGAPLPIIEEFVYDLAGNLVWQSNNHTVAATAFDCHGNAVEAVDPVGVRTRTHYDAWNRPTRVETFSSTGDLIASSDMTFSATGRMKESTTLVDAEVRRESRMVWDGGGRQTGVEVAGRVSHSMFDSAGRLTSSLFGGGSLMTPRPMQKVDVGSHDSLLVGAASVAEGSGSPVAASLTHDVAGNVTQQVVGSLSSQQEFDQAGHVVSAALPSRPEASFAYDSRGAMTQETQADGSSTIAHQYDAGGTATQYRDQTGEVTETINDRIGRPRSRTYADGTSETFEYDGPRLLSMKDRQGRVFNYIYDDKGQVLEIRAGGGPLLDKFEYDAAGRMTKWSTGDAVLTWENFDFENRPRKTTQTRVDAAGTPIDSYVQQHEWNVHGERSAWTMPSYAGFVSSAPWTAKVFEERDDAGNVAAIDRVVGSAQSELMRARYRNAGRPDAREVTAFGSSAPIARQYGYNASGQMSSMSVSSRGLAIAGSSVAFDGLQISRAMLLGISGASRANEYVYDDRGRLVASSFARESGATARALESLTPADFRLAHERTSTDPGEPPSLAFTETRGHKIERLTRGSAEFVFAYGGAERVDDGRFVYEYDFRGRMIRATEKVSGGAVGRRVSYFYAGSNRVVGRRAEYGPPWKIEDRADVIDGDGIPPDVTYVWDPVSDRVAAIFKTGSSASTSVDPNGGLVRQFIHGGLGYDDPIEVALADPNNGEVRRLYPIYDEAAAGNLQVVLNSDGEVIARGLSQDAHGNEEATLAGAGVDKITVTATTESVTVDVRFTEQLDESTVAAGASIAGATPILVDGFTLRATFEAAAFTTLPSLTITIRDTLRAAAWSQSSPILPPPDWALETKPVFTSPSVPFEYRESTASLSSWLATIADDETRTATLYEVENLATLPGAHTARPERLLGLSTFQALPFEEPATGLIYVRERWLDPRTGTFLSPDPFRYRDSSNLYAFGAGDPIANRDPRGELCERSNASSWWDWTKRCSQDLGLFAEAANENITSLQNIGKNIQRAAGGALSTGALLTDAVVGVAMLAWDTATMSLNDAAADRMVTRGQALVNVVAQPVAAVVTAHTNAATSVLLAESYGNYVASGQAAASIVQKDALAAYGAYAVGRVASSGFRRIGTVEAMPDPYSGVREASKFLRQQGVSRADRVRILGSFETRGMKVRTAGQTEFGLRYFGGQANPGGAYLFDTFPASRGSLALRLEWNAMSELKQWQLRPGATVIEGRAAAQGAYLPGGQMQKFVLDWRYNLLEP